MEKDKQKISIPMKTRFGYGVGAIGLDMSYGLCMSYFIYYCTDIAGLDSAVIGIVVALARVWDGINDPMMGMIVSNTKNKRFGRFRPWILTGAVLNAFVLVMMFANPGFKMPLLNYIYVAFFYVLWGMSYTIIDIPYWSFVPSLTNDPYERNVITSFPRFFSGIGQFFVMGATSLILDMTPPEKEGKIFSSIALVIAVFFIFFAGVTFGTTKEKIVPKDKTSYGFKEIFKVIRENDQIPVFLLVAIIYNLGWYTVNGLARYFFVSIVENETMMTVFSAVAGVSQGAGLFLLTFLSKKIGKYKTTKLAMIVSAVGYVLMFLTTLGSSFNAVLFFIFLAISGLGIGCTFTSEASMLADIVDYGEYKTGRRSDAITFSMKSFQMKAAQTIQAMLIGFGLKISHYQANVYPQPQSGRLGITVMMFLIPPLLALTAYVIFSKKYKLHSRLMDDITDKMKEVAYIENYGGKEK